MQEKNRSASGVGRGNPWFFGSPSPQWQKAPPAGAMQTLLTPVFRGVRQHLRYPGQISHPPRLFRISYYFHK
jgi:hypothetical protein